MDVAGEPVVVRACDPAVAARIAERLAPWRIEHPDRDADISLKVAAHEDGRRFAHSVYRRGFVARTTYSLDEALDTVEQLVHTFGPAPEGTTALHVRALERDGSVVLVSDTFSETVDGHHRRLARAGFRSWAHNPVLVDPARCEALLPHGPPGSGSWSRFPIAGVVVFAPEVQPSDSPSVRITHLTALVAGRDRPIRGADVQALVRLSDVVPFVRLDVVAPNDVVKELVGLAVPVGP